MLPFLVAAPSRADPINLDNFLGGLEKGCNLSKPLATFRSELNQRYSYEEGAPRLQAKVHVPDSIKRAVGRAEAVKHAEYTMITVPLAGAYRGLPTLAITFEIGHSNGVNVTTLSFGAPAGDVRKVLGADVARTMQEFQLDPETKDFGFSAKILPKGSQSELVCNTST